MDHQSDDDRIAGVARWLIAEARLSLAPLGLIDRFCHKLVEFGVPLWRLRAGQRLANRWPAPGGHLDPGWLGHARVRGGTDHALDRCVLRQPLPARRRARQSFRRRLLDLAARDHQVLHEMAAAGGTDYLAVPLEYGDGSVQGLSLVSDGKDGLPTPISS